MVVLLLLGSNLRQALLFQALCLFVLSWSCDTVQLWHSHFSRSRNFFLNQRRSGTSGAVLNSLFLYSDPISGNYIV